MSGGIVALFRYHLAVAQREVLRNAYFLVRVDDRTRIVRMWRTSEPFPNLQAVRAGYEAVIEAFDRVGREGRCLLSDLRAGPARNDPDFEKIVTPMIPLLHMGFLRNAILVQLAVGALQIKRHAKTDGVERLITSSEEEALRYLKEVL